MLDSWIFDSWILDFRQTQLPHSEKVWFWRGSEISNTDFSVEDSLEVTNAFFRHFELVGDM